MPLSIALALLLVNLWAFTSFINPNNAYAHLRRLGYTGITTQPHVLGLRYTASKKGMQETGLIRRNLKDHELHKYKQ